MCAALGAKSAGRQDTNYDARGRVNRKLCDAAHKKRKHLRNRRLLRLRDRRGHSGLRGRRHSDRGSANTLEPGSEFFALSGSSP